MGDGGKASLRGGNDDGRRFGAGRELPDAGHPGRDRELGDGPRELTRLEDALVRAQRFDGIGRLAQGVAHDVGNLVAVIANSSVSARQRLGEGGGVVACDLDQIDRAARMVGEISRQLLAVAREVDADRGPVDVVATADGVVALLGRSLGSQVDLRLVLGAVRGCRVEVRRPQLEQVLVNLVLNARDALLDGAGTITVTVSSEIVPGPAGAGMPGTAIAPPVPDGPRATATVLGGSRGLDPGAHVVIAVDDDGVGMTPEVARRAAEPLFSTKPAGDHAGLGLATVAGIAQRAGGEVRLRTAPGRGTTVTVVLPAAMAVVPTPL